MTAVSAAQTAAAIGPALAMVALQMQLSEITGLVRTNIALTSQVLTHYPQRAVGRADGARRHHRSRR